jgi:CubicO group peptidase (beta-lactamase class C family)
MVDSLRIRIVHPYRKPDICRESEAMNTPSRRAFLASSFAAFLAGRSAAADPYAPFDRLMATFLIENKVPGAALAVARNGAIVYSRAFGYADRAACEVATPASLFRIASLSKPVTAVAILQLIEKGMLGLDDKVRDRMPLKPLLAPGAKVDERWNSITVRHCLQHTGGWDRNKSYDPIVKAWEIAKAFGMQPPVKPEHVVRYMMGQPLDFDPGARYAYSNLGYLILGRILESLTGQAYESYVTERVFNPIGVTTAKLGRALLEDRAKNEVRYSDSRNGTGKCLYPPKLGETVPTVYGAMNLEAYEAHGGWIATAEEMARFAAAFHDPKRCPLLNEKSIGTMWTRPAGATGPVYYALGWQVRPTGGAAESNQ